MGSGSPTKKIHGVTSSLWHFGLMAQSWLMSRGLVVWHRRVARGMILLLLVLAISALSNTSQMLTASIIPCPGSAGHHLRRFSVDLAAFRVHGTRLAEPQNAASPQALHVIDGAYGIPARVGAALWQSGDRCLWTDSQEDADSEPHPLALMFSDWRNGERTHRAYPLFLVWNLAFEFLADPLSATSGWLAFCRWFAAGG